MKLYLSILTLVFSTNLLPSQIPVETYREEISSLNGDQEIFNYWKKLEAVDQEILVNLTDVRKADSLSIDQMIRTALVFEIHGTNKYTKYNSVPIINLSHNYVGSSQLAFWPIIERCSEIGGVIDTIGGEYPAYVLESVSLTFYNYSLFAQESKYPELLEHLSHEHTTNVVAELEESFQTQRTLSNLRLIEVMNSWYNQSYKEIDRSKTFSLVEMSDGKVYINHHGRFQQLDLIQGLHDSQTYRIVNEPFGWSYIYRNDGSLSLVDKDGSILMEYTIAD
ncbi:hypothetical protein [Nonlabens ponticola]|uniref:Uncharacterized protein n=1 Tax=Nonlabens ponticola TaxID=2496866 RepID=A0A3S9MYA4_9FLAO|nr:hypothetical protein [Nonlabens ponticola]AZQ44225.1 hypothetical protein EJ995_08245 [Nonlabens ponticola]